MGGCWSSSRDCTRVSCTAHASRINARVTAGLRRAAAGVGDRGDFVRAAGKSRGVCVLWSCSSGSLPMMVVAVPGIGLRMLSRSAVVDGATSGSCCILAVVSSMRLRGTGGEGLSGGFAVLLGFARTSVPVAAFLITVLDALRFFGSEVDNNADADSPFLLRSLTNLVAMSKAAPADVDSSLNSWCGGGCFPSTDARGLLWLL